MNTVNMRMAVAGLLAAGVVAASSPTAQATHSASMFVNLFNGKAYAPFTIEVTARDTAAPAPPGVDLVELYAYRQPENGDPAFTLGVAAYRTDLGRFILTVSNLPGGQYRFVARTRSSVSGAFVEATDTATVAEIPSHWLKGLIVRSSDSTPGTHIWEMSGFQVGLVRAFQDSSNGNVISEDANWALAGTGPFIWPKGGANPGYSTADLLWHNQITGALKLWRMERLTAYYRNTVVSLNPDVVRDTNWKVEAVADMNGDHTPDLIWRHVTDGYLAVWLMSGTVMQDSIYMNPWRIADNDWKIVGTGDFNRDLKPDLVWQHQTQGWIAVWLMDGTRMVDSVYTDPWRMSDANWKIRTVRDMNNDGWPDLVWQHNDSNLMQAWMLRGTRMTGSQYLTYTNGSPYGPAWWHIVGPK